MRQLPVRFPQDPYCRALSRLMLTLDAETGECYLGVTPDGTAPGRDMLAKLTLWAGEEQVPYTAAQEGNVIRLKTEKGCASLALAMPNRLLIEAEGLSVLIGKGKALGMFMSGGSAVDDIYEGALYVNSGVRQRIVPRKGTVEVRSAWDLSALSDPNPRIFLHPDGAGKLDAVIYVTDFDEKPTDDGMTVAEAAEDAGKAFEAFLKGLVAAPADEEALHAAYIVWTALQPARVLNEQRITSPEYVSNRRSLGTAMLFDNVLLAALLKDPAAAAERLASFLQYANEDGIVPRQADNRRFLIEAEAPLFGLVYKARPELIEAASEADYEAQKKALAFWQAERWCPERKLFYYLHRYEPGCGKKLPFAETPPEFAPELNAYMLLWLRALEKLALRFGKAEEAAAFKAQAEAVKENMLARLWTGAGWQFINILDEPVCAGHPGAAAALVAEELGKTFPLPEKLPGWYILPLLIAGPEDAKKELAARVKARKPEITNLRQALTVLAAGLVG